MKSIKKKDDAAIAMNLRKGVAKYKYLPHTADTKFRAYGKTLEEAFANAALAMTNVMVDTAKVKQKATKKIAAKGDDVQSLLYSFLEQFLILLDSKNFFLSAVKAIKIRSNNSSYELNAAAVGDDAANYETVGPQVKAVTYNDMLVEEKKGNCMVQVVLDI